MKLRFCILALLAVAAFAQDVRDIFDRAVDDFFHARIKESVVGFDKVAQLLPEQAPQLWQRGIALYYAGRFKDCRLQFESHRTVNPNDVENAAWHFLCVARAESPEKAQRDLLPVGPDSRTPMREIYQMFNGKLGPEQVLAAAGSEPEGRFYAHLYIGLYNEALGRKSQAREHIRLAADDRFGTAGGYMHRVARVHRQLLQ